VGMGVGMGNACRDSGRGARRLGLGISPGVELAAMSGSIAVFQLNTLVSTRVAGAESMNLIS